MCSFECHGSSGTSKGGYMRIRFSTASNFSPRSPFGFAGASNFWTMPRASRRSISKQRFSNSAGKLLFGLCCCLLSCYFTCLWRSFHSFSSFFIFSFHQAAVRRPKRQYCYFLFSFLSFDLREGSKYFSASFFRWAPHIRLVVDREVFFSAYLLDHVRSS